MRLCYTSGATDCVAAASASLQAQDAKQQLIGIDIYLQGPPQGRSTLGQTEDWQYNSGNGRVQRGAWQLVGAG
jgi:hypothetical protein